MWSYESLKMKGKRARGQRRGSSEVDNTEGEERNARVGRKSKGERKSVK